MRKPIVTRRLDIREGIEGPKHDPYAWIERTMYVNDCAVTLRSSALGTDKLFVAGKEYESSGLGPVEGNRALVAFEIITGLTTDRFDRAYEKLHRDDIDDPMGRPSQYI